ncbi:glycine dehydrogenase, partial [Bacillus cereus]|nr:glycine dehydrogenase [Bacillus cereus]
MLHSYLPMTEEDKKEMLQTIGVKTIDELFSDIPESVRFKGDLKNKEAKSEPELLKELSQMASKKANLKEYASFLVEGVYDHNAQVIVE